MSSDSRSSRMKIHYPKKPPEGFVVYLWELEALREGGAVMSLIRDILDSTTIY